MQQRQHRCGQPRQPPAITADQAGMLAAETYSELGQAEQLAALWAALLQLRPLAGAIETMQSTIGRQKHLQT